MLPTCAHEEPSELTRTVNDVTQWSLPARPCVATPTTSMLAPMSMVMCSPEPRFSGTHASSESSMLRLEKAPE